MCVQLHLKLILIPLDRPAIVTLVHTVKSPMKHDGQTMLCHPTDVSKPHRIYSEPCNPKESNFRALLELLKWPITLNPKPYRRDSRVAKLSGTPLRIPNTNHPCRRRFTERRFVEFSYGFRVKAHSQLA